MERVGWVWRVRPGKAEEYDAKHAEIWPEMTRLLHAAGIASYTIYRWGDVLFSHMEVEDYERMVEQTGSDPLSERWEEYMADLIEYPNADPETGMPERLRHVWSLAEPPAEEER